MKKSMIQRGLSILFVLVVVLLIVSFFQKGKLPDINRIHPDLLKNPVQKETREKPFTTDYKGTTYSITPVADYELWGLVVSHNKTAFVFDIYHDKTSFDTKDIAVIWGSNLKSNDFKEVKYWSGPWSGRIRREHGVKFDENDYSNNHLITSENYTRRKIAGIQIGDQIHFKGMLVNYTQPRWNKHERKSSTTREDKGNGACEVVFVEEMETLRNGTPVWYVVYFVTIRLLFIIPLLKLLLFIKMFRENM